MTSIALELPQIMQSCIPGSPKLPLVKQARAFTNSILNVPKFIVYLDTSLNLIYQNDWVLAGYYGMYFFLNMIYFIAFVSLNNSMQVA